MTDKKLSSILKLDGLVEETKKMIDDSDVGKLAHPSSYKAPTRVTGGKFCKLLFLLGLQMAEFIRYRLKHPYLIYK
jgi:hypothetical protein